MNTADRDRADKAALLYEAAALLRNEPEAAERLRTVAKKLDARETIVDLDFFVAAARMIVKGLN